MKQIFNGQILTPQGWLKGGSVVTDGNKIAAILTSELPIEGAERIDAKGASIVPGGIEMHVHGGGGRDFMEGTVEAFREAVDAHLQYGTTAIYPTLSSSTVPMIEKAVEACQELMNEPDSPIMGLHLEGPYTNSRVDQVARPRGVYPPAQKQPLPEALG